MSLPFCRPSQASLTGILAKNNHALSAYHPELPHDAGLIILSESYFSHFAEKLPQRFTEMAGAMGQDVDAVPAAEQPYLFISALKELQRKCAVAELKMSDYGIKKEEFSAIADNAFETMGGLFKVDRVTLSKEDIINILVKAYR